MILIVIEVIEDSWENLSNDETCVYVRFDSEDSIWFKQVLRFYGHPLKPVLIRLIDFLDLWEDGRDVLGWESWKGLERINASFR